MQYEKRWQKIKKIGKGGQGKVIRVLDKQKVELDLLVDSFNKAFQLARQRDTKLDADKLIQKKIAEIVRAENPMNHGALKILHAPDEARNFADAEERLKRELKAMEQAYHPNLLKVLDYNLQEKWFVSKYYPNGTLKDRSDWYTGKVKRTLTAIRPIVDGVATLHKKKIVHRDIKPENIFVDEREQLVLGDFGLVFFKDKELTKLSGTYENVGSSAWMPPWAMYRSIEDVTPSFDVFSLGKTIWSMVSSKSLLPFWNPRKEEFNLETMFPDRPEMALFNDLLDKCIVEDEKDCLENAGSLLEEIDSLLSALRLGADPMSDSERPCRVCGFGKYQLEVNKDRTKALNFGLNIPGVYTPASPAFKIFVCNKCGNIQTFYCQEGDDPPGWTKSTN